MSQKKCPKCGEMNPAEAVMCWACYTPLTGGAVGAGGTAAMAATPVATADQKEKKAIAPWQIGVVVAAVVLALGFGASQMMGGGSDAVDPNGDAGPVPKPPSRSGGPPTGPSPAIFTGMVAVPQSGGGGQVKVSEALDYSVASPPNPDKPWGVVALVPNDPNATPQRAAGMAQFAFQQFGGKTKWKAMQIFVFRTREAALQFNRFQIGRKYDVVADDDYPGLASIWPSCIVRYESNGNAAADVRFPSQRPNSWWRGGS